LSWDKPWIVGSPADIAYDGSANAEASVTVSLSDHPHHHDHARERGHSEVPSDPALRTKALESLLAEKGLVDPAAIDAWVEAYESRIGPRRGAQIVARAWVDPRFKALLLQDAVRAIEPFGFLGREAQHIVVLENTPTIHNLVVCTLCSCYPWGLLGLPPRWYKAAPYRARSVIDPRGVLAEFGLALGEGVEVRVWDSTAEIRYLVLPERPAGTDGLSEEQLAELVTRDAMIGVAKVEAPKGRTA
jgi:nitrile hydratase